ncbi:hypothetical protein K432DRAFT_249584, partial [Lepidopterella palustris CBS 459.81]
YFFYDTLADSGKLAELFDPQEGAERPILRAATITDGALRTRHNKYKAVADEPGLCVEGWAYRVLSTELEAAVCVYETESHEVVRCIIRMKD